MTAVIRWEEPPRAAAQAPRHRTRHSRLEPLAEELRGRPGEWALVFEDEAAGKANGMATHIRYGQLMCFAPAGDFDAVTRKVDAVTQVYARYVGDEDGAS
jgi:hypothetical protein